MTIETFEAAMVLRKQIDTFKEVAGRIADLKNSRNQTLAAGYKKVEDSVAFTIPNGDVLRVTLPGLYADKFLESCRLFFLDQAKDLEKQFKSL